MARIDRERLDGGVFPLAMEIQTRFADIDAQGHVNNAAAAVILQEARVGLNQASQLIDFRSDVRPVVAALSIEYAAEMFHGAPIEVLSGVLKVGRTSVTIGQLARQNGRPSLYGETVLVALGPEGPAEIPPALRDAYEKLLIRPQ